MLSSLLEIDIASRNLTPKAAVSQLPKTAAQRIQTIARNYSRLNATTFHPTRNIPHLFPQQDVKKVVEQLYRSGRLASVTHRRVPRPWGSYESIDAGDRFQVKRIIIAPGAQLSLQMHHHRAEHWIVVKGTGLVTNGDAEIILTENQSTYIPLGTQHRLRNPGKISLELIEVQSGSYLGEDDIVRFEDTYGRAAS